MVKIYYWKRLLGQVHYLGIGRHTVSHTVCDILLVIVKISVYFTLRNHVSVCPETGKQTRRHSGGGYSLYKSDYGWVLQKGEYWVQVDNGEDCCPRNTRGFLSFHHNEEYHTGTIEAEVRCNAAAGYKRL